jgi:import inner membrane translocase subunit TIM17
MGAVGGGAWHLVKGLRNSPSGFRVRGALESLRKEAPRLGGSFANWGLAFSCFDCSLQAIRKKVRPI